MAKTRIIIKKLSWLPITIALLTLGLLWIIVWIFAYAPGDVDFYLRQSKYRKIVTTAKSLPLPRGTSIAKEIDDAMVVTELSQSGSYTVTIITADDGDGGCQGYLYSDTPRIPRPNANDKSSRILDNASGLTTADTKIAGQGGQWWSVHSNPT